MKIVKLDIVGIFRILYVNSEEYLLFYMIYVVFTKIYQILVYIQVERCVFYKMGVIQFIVFDCNVLKIKSDKRLFREIF